MNLSSRFRCEIQNWCAFIGTLVALNCFRTCIILNFQSLWFRRYRTHCTNLFFLFWLSYFRFLYINLILSYLAFFQFFDILLFISIRNLLIIVGKIVLSLRSCWTFLKGRRWVILLLISILVVNRSSLWLVKLRFQRYGWKGKIQPNFIPATWLSCRFCINWSRGLSLLLMRKISSSRLQIRIYLDHALTIKSLLIGPLFT